MLYGEFTLARYADAPIPFPVPEQVTCADHKDIVSSTGLLIDPTRQRIEALLDGLDPTYYADFEVDGTTERALSDLNTYYAGDPSLATWLQSNHQTGLEDTARSIETEQMFRASNPLLLSVAQTMVNHLLLLATVAPSVEGFPRGVNIKLVPTAINALSIGRRTAFLCSMEAIQRAKRMKAADPKWPARLTSAADTITEVLTGALEEESASGIINLAFALSDSARHAGELKRNIDNGNFMPEAVEEIGHRPREPKHMQVLVPAYRAPASNDADANELIERFVQPSNATKLKEHPLGQMLKSGARVTLRERYEFDGFGDNAGIAASFIDHMASITDDSRVVHFENILGWLKEANGLLSAKTLSADAEQTLKTKLHVLEVCMTENFSVVAKNVHDQPDPAVLRAFKRMSQLREALAA